MANPATQFDHVLDPIQGWWAQHSLLRWAQLSADVGFDLPAGRVMHLNADGEWSTGSTGGQVPFFNMWSSDRPQCGSMGNGGAYYQGGIPKAGNIMGLNCLGDYEFETTEFDTALDYAIGDPLRGRHDDSDEDIGGIVTNASAVTVSSNSNPALWTNICGIVSRTFTNATDAARNQQFKDRMTPTLRLWARFERGASGI